MAQTDAAVVIPGTGYFLTGAVDAAAPTLAALDTWAADTTTTLPNYVNLGHTDLDEVLAFGSEGGETEVRGSWQNRSLREALTSAAVDYLVVRSLQVRDNAVLSLYYGGGDATDADSFHLPDTATLTNKSLVVVMIDAEGTVGLHVSKCSVRREAEMGVTADGFVTIPLRFTYLKSGVLPRATWIADGLGT